jgi:hypothetical protein
MDYRYFVKNCGKRRSWSLVQWENRPDGFMGLLYTFEELSEDFNLLFLALSLSIVALIPSSASLSFCRRTGSAAWEWSCICRSFNY